LVMKPIINFNEEETMPRGDGTGPAGGGAGTGRGMGGRSGRGGGAGLGPGGGCVCPACGKEVTHRPGTPCTSMRCPDCGTPMLRK